jgi:hypothetical protein
MLTRRKLTGILASAAIPLPAQAPPRPAEPTVEQARQALRGAAAQVARLKLPMSVEPAFRFRA